METLQSKLFTNRMLLRILVPLVIEQALANMVGLCDGVMVSAAGEAAISGVSLVNMISGVILVLFAALTTGGAVVTSQYLGARQREQAQQSAGQMVLMSAAFGVFLMAVCLLLAKPLLRLFFGRVDDAVMEAAVIYFRYNAVSFPFIALYNAGAAIFRSIGNSKVSMKVSVIKNVINVAGNALCVYGLKMGVEGVAIPTLVSRIAGALIMLALARSPKQELFIELKNLLHVQGKMMRSILRVGIPTAFENSLFQLGRVLVTGMISAFGTIHITANATANNITGIGIIISQGIGLGTITVVGQCIGAHDTQQANYYVKKLLLWCYIAQGTVQALLLIFQNQMIGLYSNLSPETVTLIKKLVTLYFLCAIPMYPLSFMLPNALRAANDGTFTMAVSVGSMALCRIVMAWILCTQMGMGALGVWIAMVMDWVFRSAFFTVRWFRGKWKKHCFLA